MNSKQWKEWGYIVGACKSGASSINVGSQCRRDAILAADAYIKKCVSSEIEDGTREKGQRGAEEKVLCPGD